MNETRELARFVTAIEYNDLSNEVIEKTKVLLLEQLGCQMAFATLPWSKAVYKYVRDKKGAREESTVANYGLKTSTEDAAFANAVFSHGFEMDDDEPHSISHPGCIVVSSALATGEREMISGKALLTALAVGYDVMIRIGTATRAMVSRGFHTTAAIGTFGSASATSKILKLNPDEVINALAISASESSGLGEYSETGGSVKRLHAGFAAQAGVKASLLAKMGLTGPPTAIEGKKGFCQAFADEYSLNEITEGLGKEFRILWTGNKPYSCCAAQHSTIDAVSQITQEHDFQPRDIEEITVTQMPRDVRAVGNIIEPQDIISAQFSGRFGVALRLIKGGNGFKEYSERNLKDPEILALAKRVKYVPDMGLNELAGDTAPSKVTIKLKNGTIYEARVDYARGTVQNPMTKEELEDKFRGLASAVISDKQLENIIQTVRSLEELDNVCKLGSLLVASEAG